MRSLCWTVSVALSLAIAGFAGAPGLRAQSVATGSVEFQARIQPVGGRAEPVRSLSFYLLRKSAADIRKEAEQTEPPVDLNGFIDSLSVSPELKAWMKKNNTVSLSGKDFVKGLNTDDVSGIPEFLDAYMERNGASLDAGVPAPKYKESERLAKPDKYRREHDQYMQAIKRYIAAHPESVEGIDAQLNDSDFTTKWMQLQMEQQRKIERRSQMLAQTTYLAAQIDSDLEGRGTVTGLAPGTYWLTTLGAPAMAGDVRLQWDLPVQVASGRTALIDLNNLNAIEPASRPPR
jgi:hypothetical protein